MIASQGSTSTRNFLRPVMIVAAFEEALGEVTGNTEMPMQQQQLLLQLYIHGELPQAELHKWTRVEKSANSRNVLKLGPGEKPWLKAGPGYVESYEDARNRRIKHVRLTPKGKAIIEEAASRVATLF